MERAGTGGTQADSPAPAARHSDREARADLHEEPGAEEAGVIALLILFPLVALLITAFSAALIFASPDWDAIAEELRDRH